jgi:hypothetical protein
MEETQPIASNDKNAAEPAGRLPLDVEPERITLKIVIGVAFMLTVILAWIALFWFLFV